MSANSGETTILRPAAYVPGGRSVIAERGWAWIAGGWDLFKKQAGMWIALMLVALVIFVVLALIPFIGSMALSVLSPVFGAGVVIGCRAIEEGRALEIGHLFAGFKEKLAPLATVGAIYLGATIVIVLVVMLVSGVSVFSIAAGGDPAAAPAAILAVLLAVLVILALMLPLFMAVWFAPALVVFQGKSAVDAMKESFSGCMRNIMPFLIYGVVMLVFSVLASVPLLLGWLVLGPVLAASLYTSYKDIYLS
jgi:membrane-anchored glycerophosphoryl diester phosphodiesterase (GDPDase)